LSKEEVVALAWTGEQAAIMWSKFCHWLPLDFGGGAAPPEAQPEEAQFDLQEARRRHAIALICSIVLGMLILLRFAFYRDGVCRILFCKSLKWIAYYV